MSDKVELPKPTERDMRILEAVVKHGYLGEGLPLGVVGVGCCGVCWGHSPSWDGHAAGCKHWVRDQLEALLAWVNND